MAQPTTPGMLNLSAGILTGLGIAGTSFTLVLAAFGKLMPAEWRGFAFGVGTAAGSFGQFLFSPLAVGLISILGWQRATDCARHLHAFSRFQCACWRCVRRRWMLA